MTRRIVREEDAAAPRERRSERLIAQRATQAAAQEARNARHRALMTCVTWKHEGTVEGQPVGPCVVDDLAAAEADPLCQGFGMPYGYKPAWRDDRGWMTLAQARVVAAEHGVTLQVS